MLFFASEEKTPPSATEISKLLSLQYVQGPFHAGLKAILILALHDVSCAEVMWTSSRASRTCRRTPH